MTPGILAPAAWAGLIALDIIGFGPFMITQPMVCGPLFGGLTGNLTAGVILGGIVQLLWMDITPVGVGIPFDAMAVTLLAIYGTSLHPEQPVFMGILSLALAVPFGFVFQVMDHSARRINTWIARRVAAVPDRHLTNALSAGILAGLAWSWVRYTVFYALSMMAMRTLWKMLSESQRLPSLETGWGVALILLPMAGMGVVLELFLSDEPERRLHSARHPRHPKGSRV